MSLGLSDEQLGQKETSARSFQALAVEQKKLKRKRQDDEAKGEITSQLVLHDSSQLSLPVDPIPPRYTRIEELLATALRDKLLPMVDPVVLSSSNLRALKTNGSALKVTLLVIWAYTTGLQRSMALSGRNKCYNSLGGLGNQRALERGRRAMALALPPDFAGADGIAEVDMKASKEGGPIVIRHRFTNELVRLPISDLPPFQSLSDLTITANHSEAQLALTSKLGNSEKSYNSSNCFKTHSVAGNFAASAFLTPPRSKMMRGDMMVVASPSADRNPNTPTASVADGSDDILPSMLAASLDAAAETTSPGETLVYGDGEHPVGHTEGVASSSKGMEALGEGDEDVANADGGVGALTEKYVAMLDEATLKVPPP